MEPTDSAATPADSPAAAEAPPAPLWRRSLQVFVDPAALGDDLARHPRWFGALLLGAVLVVASTLLIPAEIWQEMFRAQLMASGQEVPPGMDEMGATFVRIWALVGGTIFWGVWAVLVAGLTTVVFAFVLGDQGHFRHYLAATCHALLIAAVGSLLLVPLRIAQSDPQLTLNVGTFLGDLGSGYWARFLGGLDLFLIWSFAVLAVMATRFDRRRSLGSAITVLLVVLVGFTGLIALLPRLA